MFRFHETDYKMRNLIKATLCVIGTKELTDEHRKQCLAFLNAALELPSPPVIDVEKVAKSIWLKTSARNNRLGRPVIGFDKASRGYYIAAAEGAIEALGMKGFVDLNTLFQEEQTLHEINNDK